MTPDFIASSFDESILAFARGDINTDNIDARQSAAWGNGDVSAKAITGVFSPSAGIISVFGDAANNIIDISRNAAGTILVNGGAVTVLGGTATVANTTLIQAFGQRGTKRSRSTKRMARCLVPICSAAPATTRCRAARAVACSSARAATMSSLAKAALISCSAVREMTR